MAAAATAPSRAPARAAPARRRSRSRAGAAQRSRPRPNRALASGRGATRRAPARRAPSGRARSGGRTAPVAPRMIQPAVAGAALIPHAAARTANTVRDLSDSSLIVRLTRGRGWIGVLCALLGGIVALNVISLSLSAGSGRLSIQLEGLERENSALRAQIAERLSASKVEAAASQLGFAVPDPKEITYLSAEDGDANELARLLDNETFLSSDSTYVVPSVPSGSSYTPSSSYGSASQTSTVAPSATAPSIPSSGGGSTGTSTSGSTSSGSSSGSSGASTGGVGL
jgi:hypothetical protein